jgi:hypothetical protein
MTMRVAIAALSALLAGAGCGSTGESRTSATVTVDSSGRYPIVRSAGRADQWKAELIVSVGEVAADSAGGFGTVRSVLLDSTGRVFVLDPSYHQLLVFDSSGSPLAKWGRRGSGPGEFELPYSIAALGGSVAVLDPGAPRIMLLGPEGQWMGQWPYARITGSNIVRLYRTPGGFWSLGTRPGGDGKLARTFIRHTADGPRDTINGYMPPPAGNETAICRRPDGSMTFFAPPFGAMPYVIPDGEGRQFVATGTGYRIVLLARTLDTLRVIEREVALAPITDAEWDESLREYTDWRAEKTDEHCDRDGWDRPASKAPVNGFFLDDDGLLWVEVLGAEGRSYDVFGEDGVLRATVTGLPESGGIDPSVVNGRVAMAVNDSLDVQTVQVYRIRKP